MKNIILRKHASLLRMNIGLILMTFLICYVVCNTTRENAFVNFEQSKIVVFAYSMALIWTGLFDSLLIFNEQRLYVLADFDNRTYSPLEYLVAIMTIEMVLGALQALIASTVFFHFFGDVCNIQGIVTPFGKVDFVLTVFLSILASISLGWMIGTICEAKWCIVCVPVVLILQMLFSQCIFTLPESCENYSIFVMSKYVASTIGSLVDLNRYPLKITLESAIKFSQPYQDIYRISRGYMVSNWAALIILAAVPLVISWGTLTIKANQLRR